MGIWIGKLGDSRGKDGLKGWGAGEGEDRGSGMLGHSSRCGWTAWANGVLLGWAGEGQWGRKGREGRRLGCVPSETHWVGWAGGCWQGRGRAGRTSARKLDGAERERETQRDEGMEAENTTGAKGGNREGKSGRAGGRGRGQDTKKGRDGGREERGARGRGDCSQQINVCYRKEAIEMSFSIL